MYNLIDCLSPEAKTIFYDYGNCNVGILCGKLPPDASLFRVFDISVYEKKTTFTEVVGGISTENYKKLQPVPVKSFSVLVNGTTDDSGCLLGLLNKHKTNGGYYYKKFDQLEFVDKCIIKYDYSKFTVKLVEPYSFLKGGGRKI